MATRTQWSIYGLLIAMRLLFSLLLGYIQPDEFFQSPEIMAGSVFDLEVFTPWEFDPAAPARSIVPPLLTTGIPFYAYKIAHQWIYPYQDQAFVNGLNLFYVQRLSFFLLSLLLDLSLVKLCRLSNINHWKPLILLSSSYVMLVYQCHTFSNSFESVVLALSTVLLSFSQSPGGTESSKGLASFCLGVLLVLGIFTRITFILYGAPLGVAILYLTWKRAMSSSLIITDLAPFTFGFALSISAFTLIDSMYFKHLRVELAGGMGNPTDMLFTILYPTEWEDIQIEGKITSTILNNILYNVDKNNLELHGLHPYYLHALVNVPLLYGPIGLWLYWRTIALCRKQTAFELDQISTVMLASIFVGLLGLSAFPHQEPRFLTPMLLPLILIFARNTNKLSKKFWLIWILFNTVLAVMFGWVHQGGVVRATIEMGHQSLQVDNCKVIPNQYAVCDTGSKKDPSNLSSNERFVTNLVFYKTLMPPRHLIAYPKSYRATGDLIVNVIDLAGMPLEKATSVIQSSLHVPETYITDISKPTYSYNAMSSSYERTLLIMPNTAMPPTDEKHMLLLTHYWPHINFDHIDILVQNLSLNSTSLNVYQLVHHNDVEAG